MTALMHAHDSRIHFKLDEIASDIKDLIVSVLLTGGAMDESDLVLAKARLANLAVMERAHDVAKHVAILREMLGVR